MILFAPLCASLKTPPASLTSVIRDALSLCNSFERRRGGVCEALESAEPKESSTSMGKAVRLLVLLCLCDSSSRRRVG